MRLALVVAFCLTSAGCSGSSDNIDGRYDDAQGTTLTLSRGQYTLCQQNCYSGRFDVRPTDRSSGRVTFYGRQISDYFGNGEQTWKGGAETSYEVGLLSGPRISVDAASDFDLKRVSRPPSQ